MTYRIFGLALTAPTLLLAVALNNTEPVLKCGPQAVKRDPVFILDGAIATVGKPDSIMRTLKPDDIEAIQVLCVDPKDSTTISSSGIPSISITTKLGPASYIKPQLRAIMDAQSSSLRERSRYVENLTEIQLPFRSRALTVTLDVREKGWVARATVEGSPLVCYVFDGAVAAPPRGVSKGQPECLTNSRAE